MNSYVYYLLVEKIWLHCQKASLKIEQRHSSLKSQDVCMMGGTNLAPTTQTPLKIWGALSLLALTKLWKGPLTSHLSSTLEFIGCIRESYRCLCQEAYRCTLAGTGHKDSFLALRQNWCPCIQCVATHCKASKRQPLHYILFQSDG